MILDNFIMIRNTEDDDTNEILPVNAVDGLGGLVSNANRTNYKVQVVGGLV